MRARRAPQRDWFKMNARLRSALHPLARIAEPLRAPVFRSIWISSLFSNLGQQVQAVAAAWTMVQLTDAPDKVALVQTASMIPIMLIALPGGAIADMYDRRKAAIAALLLALAGACGLMIAALWHLLTPGILLVGCFVVGSGIALFSPAWQASVSEQVGESAMPAAVALYAMSSNIARSVGPAVGGVIVAGVGATVAFGINALLYVPILIALLAWKRRHEPPRLPPEGMARALRSGLRYITLSPALRRVLLRALMTGTGASAVFGLMPFVARTSLHGDASSYGILLGAFGIGAVSAGFTVNLVRERAAAGKAITVLSLLHGAALIVVGFSDWLPLTAFALFVAGASWVVTVALYSIGMQLSAPRWVTGRAIAALQATVAAGLGLGSWVWGHVAVETSVASGMIAAGALLLLTPLLEMIAPMPPLQAASDKSVPAVNAPVVNLELSSRSGPVIVEAEYRVAEQRARAFYHLMLQIRRVRERNGAYGASLARDMADPELWVERVHYPTWHDYLRARDRPTQSERDLQLAAVSLQIEHIDIRIRRLLERPFGSVRWTETAPDISSQSELLIPPGGVIG